MIGRVRGNSRISKNAQLAPESRTIHSYVTMLGDKRQHSGRSGPVREVAHEAEPEPRKMDGEHEELRDMTVLNVGRPRFVDNHDDCPSA